MKMLKYKVSVVLMIVMLASCGIGKKKSEKHSESQPTKADSAAYQQGVERAVNEKLLEKYKQKEEKK